ncbi:MAG TPA: hypothetical protein VGG88_04490 [Gaiellaceae bacterium]
MPAESERLRRRVQPRDRWFIGLAAIAAAASTAGFALTSHHQPPPAGCVSTIVVGFMGGETHVTCATPPAR